MRRGAQPTEDPEASAGVLFHLDAVVMAVELVCVIEVAIGKHLLHAKKKTA